MVHRAERSLPDEASAPDRPAVALVSAVPSPEMPTSIEPIVGWRVWRLHATAGGYALRSVMRDDIWPAGEPMRALCEQHRGFAVPSIGCTCGIYASDSPESLARANACSARTSVVGAIAMWGTVAEHATGMRSRFAYPARLRLVCAACLASGRGAVEPMVVERTGADLVALCMRHARRASGPGSLDASEVQAELLDTYAVEVVPLPRVARALVIRDPLMKDPEPLVDLITTLQRGAAMVFMVLGFLIDAIATILLIGWIVGIVVIVGGAVARLFS